MLTAREAAALSAESAPAPAARKTGVVTDGEAERVVLAAAERAIRAAAARGEHRCTFDVDADADDARAAAFEVLRRAGYYVVREGESDTYIIIW